jgi:uncharacterized protein YggE
MNGAIMQTRWFGAAIGGATIGLLAAGVVLVADRHQSTDTATAAPVTVAGGTPAVATRTVTVSGEGSVTVKPDTASINLGVQATASTATAALDQANTAAAKLIQALKSAAVADDDIVTNGVSVYPMYNGSNRVTSYQASNTVTVTVRSIDHTGPVIDAAAAAAGDNITIGGVSFSVADPEAVIGAARAKAIVNAKTRAGQFAEAAGAKVGEVLQISEVSVSPVPVYYAGAADTAAGKAASTPVQTGTQDMSVSVTVVFALA